MALIGQTIMFPIYDADMPSDTPLPTVRVHAVGSGSGGTGGGDASAANQTAGNALLTDIKTNTTGASTAALQTTGNTSLATIATSTAAQATAALQTTGNTALASILTNTTGASTAALQSTGNTSLASIATNTAAGNANAANQTTGNASLATIATNTTGASTAALQTSGNASLTTIATNSGTQATAANQSTEIGHLASIVTNTTPLLSTTPAAVQHDTAGISNNGTALTPKFAAIAASGSGNNTIVAAVTSKKIRVLTYNLMANGAVNAKFQTGAGGTDLTGLKYLSAAGAGISVAFCPVGLFETAAGVLLNLNLSAAVAVGGELTYVEV